MATIVGVASWDHQLRWPLVVVVLVGAWLVGCFWLLPTEVAILRWSLALGGLAALICATLWRADRVWPTVGIVFVGLGLVSAPVVLEADRVDVALQAALAGMALIVFAGVVPTVHGEVATPPAIPPGWTFNPSAWNQRLRVVGLALLALFGAVSLTAYQLGWSTSVWDPFFGDGSERVLTSHVSEAFPVSDAGLGAIAYLCEASIALVGGTRRWRTMPWAVLAFGLLIIPTGVTSLVLLMLQPLAVGAWCTLCLAIALVMLVMVAPAFTEVVATTQFLRARRRQGDSMWRMIWHGGEEPIADRMVRPRAIMPWWRRMPWQLLVVAGIGGWLLFAPYALGTATFDRTTQAPLAVSDHLAGAAVVSVALIAMSEIARMVRWLNIPLGLWIAMSPALLSGSTSVALVNGMVCGIAVLALSLPRGVVLASYGSWNRWIR